MNTVLSVVHSGNLSRWDRVIVLSDGKVSSDTKNIKNKR
jgi:hypothetical protein